MKIKNSKLEDLDTIFKLYEIATAYMKSKAEVAWPKFEKKMVIAEIKNKSQWKLEINEQVACVWATTLKDELIWGEDNEPSLYIHRIASNPSFRGQRLVGKILDWSKKYCIENKLKFVRMDTVGLNKGLIKHYGSFGFEFLGIKKLKDTTNLPEHYKEDDVCLFQKEL